VARPDAAFRIESDSMGEIEVPADRYWGAQTQRSLEHFAIGADRMPLALIHSLAEVKRAAARTNLELGELDAERAGWIERAADEVIAGALDEQFPLRVWQTGSGTQTNMNVNEVIANRAIELAGGVLGSKDPVHPNDHVNRSQSSNDVFPTAMHVAAARAFTRELIPELCALRDALDRKRAEFDDVVKVGRTHQQDAVPLTLGQEISGWVAQLDASVERIEATLGGLYELAIGGTAVGTGLNAPPGFGAACAAQLAERTGLPFVPARNRFAALAAHDALVASSGALRGLAVALLKIANDVRWAASGPRCGLGELELPANEPGSSIMPGKLNPTQCEALSMLAVQVIGSDTAVALAGSQGSFELNVYKPLIASGVLHSARLLGDGCRSFRLHLVEGLRANREHLAETVERSLMRVTALVPRLGYDAAARIAHEAHARGTTLREACLALGALPADEFDALVDPARMARPHGDPESTS
jgi:fumarate hydratase class II